MFKPTDSRRDLWFNPSCTWSAEEYRLVGVLVGLAIHNATLLGAHLHRRMMPANDSVHPCVPMRHASST